MVKVASHNFGIGVMIRLYSGIAYKYRITKSSHTSRSVSSVIQIKVQGFHQDVFENDRHLVQCQN